jgi:hypothetical protein
LVALFGQEDAGFSFVEDLLVDSILIGVVWVGGDGVEVDEQSARIQHLLQVDGFFVLTTALWKALARGYGIPIPTLLEVVEKVLSGSLRVLASGLCWSRKGEQKGSCK